jgi:hypothetical protein
VAVKIPNKMPPRIIKGAPNAKIALLNRCQTSFRAKAVVAAYPFLREMTVATPMRDMPMRMPGRIPPAKRRPMEAPVRNPKMIMGMDGGMMTPMEPPEACTAAAKSEA